jgi:hypothetical protein
MQAPEETRAPAGRGRLGRRDIGEVEEANSGFIAAGAIPPL